MSRGVFELLFDDVGQHLPAGLSTNKKSLSGRERLLTFLFHASGAMFNRHSSYAHQMSYGAVCQSITICIDVLHKVIVPQYIQLPTEEEAKIQAELFHQNSHCAFPPIVWGAIDGTHVTVIISLIF
jgi:hypothetical protein